MPTKSWESVQGLTLPNGHDLNGMSNFTGKYFKKGALSNGALSKSLDAFFLPHCKTCGDLRSPTRIEP